VAGIRAAVAFAAIGVLGACSPGEVQMRPGPRARWSQGTITTSTTDDGKTRVLVEVDQMLPPAYVVRSANVYVAWAEPQRASESIEKLGVIPIGDDRRGRLEAVTELRSFEVLVTPEQSADVLAPANGPILRGTVRFRE
jgi:hypothetical protein